MKKLYSLGLVFFTIFVFSQNSYQKNLYQLNGEINSIQKKLKDNKLTNDLLIEEFEIVKSLNRLSEEVLQQSLNGEIDEELATLIDYACVIAKQKMSMLESYKKFNNNFYLQKFKELDSTYLSIYLKIKTKE